MKICVRNVLCIQMKARSKKQHTHTHKNQIWIELCSVDWSTEFKKIFFSLSHPLQFSRFWPENPFQWIHKLNLPIVELPNCISILTLTWLDFLRTIFTLSVYNHMRFVCYFVCRRLKMANRSYALYEIYDWSNETTQNENSKRKKIVDASTH